MTPPLRFDLRRHSDGLVYHFTEATDAQGRRGFKRSDGDYWIVRHPRLGWIGGTWDSDEVFGRPWDQSLPQSATIPPQGIWVSRKGSRAYVYDLVHCPQDDA